MITLSASGRGLVVANWKMYVGRAESVRTARLVRRLLARTAGRKVEVVICPSFPSLPEVSAVLKGSRIRVGTQDMHAEETGPYTGDVSVRQLQGLVRYAIIGHSERRRFHAESDEQVAAKVHRALRSGLQPIVCVGETAEEREAGETVSRIRSQVAAAFANVPGLSLSQCVVAYEPVWAIRRDPQSPAEQPAPEEVSHLLGLVRKVLADRVGARHITRLRCLYGGSVDAASVGAFVQEPGVDGVLVGAASTKPGELSAIVRQVAATH